MWKSCSFFGSAVHLSTSLFVSDLASNLKLDHLRILYEQLSLKSCGAVFMLTRSDSCEVHFT